MRIHAFHLLREERLKTSTKPFNARGAKVSRCRYCLVAEKNCLCELQPKVACEIAALILVSDNETFKPSNTGRLIADVVEETHVFAWNRTEPQAELIALINNNDYLPFVVFPDEYVDEKARLVESAELLRLSHKAARVQVANDEQRSLPTLLPIFLDGSWREARKMFRRSDYLTGLPVLSIEPQQISEYLMRSSDNEQHLSTAEVASLVLEQLEQPSAGRALKLWFECFRETYMLSKTRYKSDPTRPALQAWKDFIGFESTN
ncbi:tRNA-uridine aminocarboxypropyltransferase [Vibrio agarivorans]|uniref:tRNA-uridine aminocarboxypropyltransferase n=1 Tax=Vibrio agarivorans TaxID=153622 RepID=UPI00222E3078|nr:DTW domain-containing protein [Vibrio agarivorans]MDN3663279.1 DTW domain-containing protein [Vibrio agarivorans]